MQWEVIAAVAGSIAAAGLLVAWPRPALICAGLVSLMLGLLSLVSLKTASLPALVAALAGLGLIGFGALVGIVESLLAETRGKLGVAGASSAAAHPGPAEAGAMPQPAAAEERVEPRFWKAPEMLVVEHLRVAPTDTVQAGPAAVFQISPAGSG